MIKSKAAAASLIHALELAEQPNYLGDPKVLDAILVEVARKAMRQFVKTSANLDLVLRNTAAARNKTARIFLGLNRHYATMPGWNKAGVIDGFVADALKLPVHDPRQRLSMLFEHFTVEILKLTTDSIRSHAFQAELAKIIRNYRDVLRGVVPPKCASD